ncbi:hypothetical protein [Micromonospora sp. ALFpr18c]|uniref:hypothetical protein n=1 Tax=Micromonospora sp. ALFpr18c TaxID=1458665 RepID=UPI001CED7947|nr:hypothetical protein [Micromonospora sp. ALFpr18c]
MRFTLGSVLLLAACTTSDRPSTGAAPTTPAAPATGSAGTAPVAAGTPSVAAATGCRSRVETGTLPDWAQTGFHGDARAPHVLGAQGHIVAVLFGNPLAQVRRDGSNNKILWVSRPATASADPTSPATLVITATLDGTGTRVTREVDGGPGPSIIDMPSAGCWHLDLRWGGRSDSMDLVYAERKP